MRKINHGVKLSHKLERPTPLETKSLISVDYTTLDIKTNLNGELDLNLCICVVFEKNHDCSLVEIENLIKFQNLFKKTYILFIWATSRNDMFYEIKKIPHSMVIEVQEIKNTLYYNTYLTFLLNNKHIFNTLVIIDPAIALNEKLDIEIFKNLKNENVGSWDALFANQSYRYYDIETLVSDFCNIQNVSHDTNRKEFIKKHQVHIPRDSGLIKVISAFGGLAFYKTHLFDNTTLYTDNTHLSLNLSISRKTNKMFIDSDMCIETHPKNAFLYV